MKQPLLLLIALIFVLSACAVLPRGQRIAPAVVTEKTPHDTDDPAIWINPQDPAASLIFGTDKETDGGLYAFDLNGRIVWEKSVYPLRRPNNVDIAYGLPLGGRRVDIAVVTEREAQALRIFSLPDMQPIDGGGIPVFAGETEPDFRLPMGVALYQAPQGGPLYAIVSRKTGPTDGTYLWQYELSGGPSGQVEARLVRKFGAYSGRKEIEAIAVDAELGYLYYSDETVGIRKYYADPTRGNAELALFGNTGFREDHEGIALVATGPGRGYLIISDQQAHTFRVFTREGTPANPHQHNLLKVWPLSTRETDGCDATTQALGPRFPRGLFVAMSTNRTFHFYRLEDLWLPLD